MLPKYYWNVVMLLQYCWNYAVLYGILSANIFHLPTANPANFVIQALILVFQDTKFFQLAS